MKSKRIIVVVVSSVVLCLSLFFIFQNETDTSISNKDLTLIYEETVSPNKEYVSNKKDIVQYKRQQLRFIKRIRIRFKFMLNRILLFLKIQIIQLIIIKNYLKKMFKLNG